MINAERLLEEIKAGKSKYDFIEIMGCPRGCVNGGDQPYVKELFLFQEDDDIMDTYIAKRAKTLYEEDELSTIEEAISILIFKNFIKNI